jgi:hypothetical protein
MILLLILLALSSGCLAPGSNPILVVQNESPDDVDIQIAVTQEIPPEKKGTVWFNETISISSGNEREIEIFTGDKTQYAVTAETENQSIAFSTRPICSGAETRLTVTSSGQLSSYVLWCEGGPATTTSTNTTES